MTPQALEALKFIFKSAKPPTRKAFLEEFAPNGEALLRQILVSHVDEVKGKLVLNEAGTAISNHEFGEQNG